MSKLAKFKKDLLSSGEYTPRKMIGFLERAENIRKEIKQIFLDAEHWNSSVRKPTEERIDVDPDGALKRGLQFLDSFIAGNLRRSQFTNGS